MGPLNLKLSKYGQIRVFYTLSERSRILYVRHLSMGKQSSGFTKYEKHHIKRKEVKSRASKV